MRLSVIYNDIELSNYIEVYNDFTPYGGAQWEPVVQSSSFNGSKFLHTVYTEKKLVINFRISGKIREKYDELQKILNVKEPKKLIFGNLPNRYFLAVPSGSLDSKKIYDRGTGTLTFLIPDGLAHSVVKQSQLFTLNSKGILEATLTNNGTEWATVDYDITMNHENGYISIVSQYGVIELGKKEEVDGYNYKRNEVLYDSTDFKDWTDDTVNIQNSNNKVPGKLESQVFNGKNILVGKDLGTGTWWHGGAKRIMFKADSNGKKGSKNCTCYLEMIYNSFIANQSGAMTLCFFDKNEKEVFSIILWKNFSGVDGTFSFGAGKNSKERVFNTLNTNGVNGFRNDRGWMSVNKMGGKLDAFIFGEHFIVNEPSIADAEIVGAQLYIAQMANRDTQNQLVSQMYLQKMRFEKVGVDKYLDIPNVFPSGTKIRIDGENKKPYINNMLGLDNEIFGSRYFKIPPGETKVQVFYSDFSNPIPTVKAYVNEVYL